MLIAEVAEFAGSWWVTDDCEALRYARGRGITTRETLDLVEGIVADGDLAADAAVELMHSMSRASRHLRMPTGANHFR